MAVTAFPDEWLAQSLEGLLTPELLEKLRGKADPGRTLWEVLVSERIATDADIIGKLSHRFRQKVADASKIDHAVRQGVPEQLARRDRKSTRLNSSHITISYAVFCLKKKKSHHYKIQYIRLY